jgi:threonine dehydrogenase-like Zn-dependent dehydrogenase
MKAAIFVEPNRIVLDEKPIPDVGPLDALIRVTTTTICGTDVHILKGEYPVAPGLTIGHEPVGVIEKLGSAVQGYAEGQRVIAGAICPSGHSNASPAAATARTARAPDTASSPSAAGGSATRSTARRPSTSLSPMPWPISRRSRTA